MRERRAEARMLCADIVNVVWHEGRLRGHSERALLEDISRSGACLQLEQPVPAGASITWAAAGHRFNGRVRYCSFREIGYFVGVEFEPASKWSPDAFEPDHLLDLQKLMG